MKRVFVQCARVTSEEDADGRAPGGAVTLELCGSWDHAGPCRWPHETTVHWTGLDGEVRVVFAARDEDEKHVRALIARALASGRCIGPEGKLSRWTAADHRADLLHQSDLAWAEKMGVLAAPS